MAVSTTPQGFHSVVPYLIVNDGDKAMAFYCQVFAAKPSLRMDYPDGSIAHAELCLGDSHIMLSKEHKEMGILSPLSLGGSPVSLTLYVEDVDRVFNRALAAGATQLRAVEDQFYGDRSGTLKDPFGHNWTISTHKEDLTEQELQLRFDAFVARYLP